MTTLNFELAGLKEMSKGFNPARFQREFDRQQVDTTRRLRTIISKQVRTKFKVPASLLGGGKLSTVRIKKVAHKRILSYRGHMIGLDKMSASPAKVVGTKRKGVRVTVKRGNRGLVKGGFLGTPKNSITGKKLVFKRVLNSKGKNTKTKNNKGKIKRLFTISIAHMVSDANIVKNGEEIAKHFAAGFSKRLSKIK